MDCDRSHTRRSSPGLTGATQYAETAVIGPKRRGGLDPPLSRGTTVRCGAAPNDDTIDVLVQGLRKWRHPSPQYKNPARPAPAGFSVSIVETALSAPGSPAAAGPRCW